MFCKSTSENHEKGGGKLTSRRSCSCELLVSSVCVIPRCPWTHTSTCFKRALRAAKQAGGWEEIGIRHRHRPCVHTSLSLIHLGLSESGQTVSRRQRLRSTGLDFGTEAFRGWVPGQQICPFWKDRRFPAKCFDYSNGADNAKPVTVSCIASKLKSNVLRDPKSCPVLSEGFKPLEQSC